MQRKILGIFVMTLLIATAVLPIVNSENTKVEDKNDSSQVSDKISVYDECGCNKFYETNGEHRGIFVFKHPGMIELPEPLDPKDASPKPTIIDTPEYFNWMDYNGEDWTTLAKNQEYPKWCGSCWDFAALGALESVINIREGCAGLDLDLSEQYVLSCLPGAGSCNGGSVRKAFLYIMKNTSSGNYCNGVIPESCMPYQADDTIPCEDKCPDWEELLVPILDWGSWAPDGSPEDIEAIKTQIMQMGPVATIMNSSVDFSLWGWTHHNPDDYYPYPGPDNQLNHAVIIVGWKDDLSIPNGGYWICKNSFGTPFGYEGFFNIEYGSLNIDSFQIIWVDYDPESFDFPHTTDANGPYYGLTNEPVQFSGSAYCGYLPYTWLWDFGDGNTSEEQNPTHVYTSPGEYSVILTVSDDSGNTSDDTTFAWIQESNAPPDKPTIEGPAKGIPGEYYRYNFTVNNDPDGSVVYLYMIAFEIDLGVWLGPYNPGDKEYFYYYWSEKGKYTVKAKAKDPYGAVSDWATLEVTIPRNKAMNRPFLNFLQNYLNLFPILRHMLRL